MMTQIEEVKIYLQEAKYICFALTIAMIVIVSFGCSYFVTAGEHIDLPVVTNVNKLVDIRPFGANFQFAIAFQNFNFTLLLSTSLYNFANTQSKVLIF